MAYRGLLSGWRGQWNNWWWNKVKDGVVGNVKHVTHDQLERCYDEMARNYDW